MWDHLYIIVSWINDQKTFVTHEIQGKKSIYDAWFAWKQDYQYTEVLVNIIQIY